MIRSNDHEHPYWGDDELPDDHCRYITSWHDGFTEATANGADRIRQLTLAARLLNDGAIVDPAWIAAQLRDLRDLLERGPQ